MAPIATDGIFGPLTKSATQTFQRQAGIVADGIVGPVTRDAMNVRCRVRWTTACCGLATVAPRCRCGRAT